MIQIEAASSGPGAAGGRPGVNIVRQDPQKTTKFIFFRSGMGVFDCLPSLLSMGAGA